MLPFDDLQHGNNAVYFWLVVVVVVAIVVGFLGNNVDLGDVLLDWAVLTVLVGCVLGFAVVEIGLGQYDEWRTYQQQQRLRYDLALIRSGYWLSSFAHLVTRLYATLWNWACRPLSTSQ